MRCDIVIATWNAIEMTRTALASIRATSNYPYRLILVDNSEEPEARAWFREIAASGEFGETLLIQNERNIGWLKATNIGIRHADAKYVCLLNNDVICGTDWLRRCIHLMEREPDIGLINPRGNERSENRRVKNVNDYAEHLAASEGGNQTELPHCSGFCMVAKAKLFHELGLLDEIFEGGYYEDNDFSYRARTAGFRCAQCDDAFVFHLGSQSFNKLPTAEKRRMIERNRRLCADRWGLVKRRLVLVDDPDIPVERLIEMVRKDRIFLIDTNAIPQVVRTFRHQHLTLLRPGLLGGRLSFLLQWIYLAHKSRIDEATVILH